MQGAPKYAKIVLTWKVHSNKEKITTYEDCGMVVTADKIIIVKDSHCSVENMQKTEGSVFELSSLESYATYKEKPKQ
jgi:hypothetical protein